MSGRRKSTRDNEHPLSRDEKLLWRPDVSDPYLVRHMTERSRIVMGLWRFRRLTVAKRAELTSESPGEFMFLNRMLIKSKMAPVKFVKNFGLPISASVEIHGTVQCRNCGARIRYLPCILCAQGVDDDAGASQDTEISPVPTQDDWLTFEPTDVDPGSPRKVEILRERALRGLPLHHEFDRKVQA